MVINLHMVLFLAIAAISVAGIAYWAIITVAVISDAIYSPNYSITQTISSKKSNWCTTLVSGRPSDLFEPYDKGVALLNLGKYNESITYFDKALNIDPKYFYALYNKAVALNKLGKYNESMSTRK